jgi:hypothetical protein
MSRLFILAFFLAVLASRLAFSQYTFDGWYLGDAVFDSLNSLQAVQGVRLWNGGTGLIMFYLFGAVNLLAGPHIQLMNGVTALCFTAGLVGAMACIACARTALLFGLFVALSHPFLFHSTFSTGIGWAGAPALIGSMWFLTRKIITLRVTTLLGILTIVSLYVYPSAPLALIALAIAHRLFQREDWQPGATRAFVITLAASYFACQVLIHVVTGDPVFRTQYAGGHISIGFDAFSIYWLYLREVFLYTTSWDTYNSGLPYFEPVLLFVLGAALYARHKLTWITTSAILIAAACATFTGPYPGVRRIMWCIPPLYYALATYLVEVRWGRAFALIALAVIGGESWWVSHPMITPNPFERAVSQWIDTVPGSRVVFIENEWDQYRSYEWWVWFTYRQGHQNDVRITTLHPNPKMGGGGTAPGLLDPPFYVVLDGQECPDLSQLWSTAAIMPAAHDPIVYRVEVP